MARERRLFYEEFKREAVRLVGLHATPNLRIFMFSIWARCYAGSHRPFLHRPVYHMVFIRKHCRHSP
jgi:hypothetical protein